MTTQATGEKARKRAEHLQKRRAALVRAMDKDLRQLRKIIYEQRGKK